MSDRKIAAGSPDKNQGDEFANFSMEDISNGSITSCKQALESLKQDEERNRLIIDCAGLGIGYYDIEGFILRMNHFACEILETTEDQLIGKHASHIFGDEMGALMMKRFTLVKNHNIPDVYEDKVTLLNRSKWYRSTYSTVKNEDGDVIGVQIISEDITNAKAAELELAKSQAILENFSDGVIRTDLSGNITFWNQGARKIFGYSYSEIIGKPVTILWQEKDHHRLWMIIKQLLDGLDVQDIEYDGLNKKNEKIPILLSLLPLKDNFGEVIELVGFSKDISALRKAQLALEENQRMLTILMGNLPGMAYRCENDADWTMRFVSQGCRDLTGFKPEELLNNAIVSFSGLIHPDDREYVRQQVAQALSENIAFEITYRIHCKDGMEKWVWEKGSLITYLNGKARYLEGFITDITDRVKTEEALRQSEEKYRLLVENQSDLVVKVDAEGNFLYVSPSYCAMFGKAEHDLIGQGFTPLVHPEDRQATLDEMKKLKQPPHTCYIEQRAMTNNGWKWLAWNDTAVLDKNGKIKEIIGVGQDITERKQAELALTESEARFRAFMDNFPANAYIKDENLRHVFVNQATSDFAGITQQEYIGKKTSDIYPPDTARELDELDRSVLDEQILIERRGYYTTPTGEARYQRDIKFPLKGLHGEKLVGGIALDLTAQKEAEERIIRQAEFEKLLAQTSNNLLQSKMGDMDINIERALQSVGEYLDLDSIGIRFENDNQEMVISHRWSQKEVKNFRRVYDNTTYPYLYNMITAGKITNWGSPADFPPELTAKEKEFLRNMKLQSLLSIPIHITNDHIAGITFSDTHNQNTFTPELVESLHLFAQIISSAIAQRDIMFSLNQSKNQYRSVVEDAPVLINRYKKDGTIIFCNQAYSDFFGKTTDELIGQKIYSLIPVNNRPAALERVNNLSSENPFYTAESKGIHHDGSERWIRWTVRALPDFEGKIKVVQSFGIDVTDEHLATIKIIENEKRFRSLFTEMENGFALLEVVRDRKGTPYDLRFLEINPAFESITGFENKNISGKTLKDVLPNMEQEWINTYLKVALEDTTFFRNDFNQRLGIHTEIRAFSPGKEQCAILLTDISEQVQLNRQVALERDKAQNYLDLIQSMVVAFDPDGNIVLANPMACRILEYEQRDLIGKNWFDTCLPYENIDEVKGIFNQVVKEKLEITEYYENPILTRSGKTPVIAWHNAALRDENGKVIGVLSAGDDITERVNAENRMRTLLDISSKMVAESYGQDILQKVADQILEKIETAQAVTVWLYDQDNDQLTIHAIAGYLDQNVMGLSIKTAEGAIGKSVSTRKSLLVSDAQHDPIFKTAGGFIDAAKNIQCLICTPLIMQDKLLGAISVDNFDVPGVLTADDLNLVESIANQLAGLVENALLFEQLQQSRTELRALSKRLLEVHEEERRKIALDLHDHFGQLLTTFKLSLRPEAFLDHSTEEQRSRLAEVVEIVDELIAAAEDLSLSLRPSILDDLGLTTAFEWHINRFSRQSDIHINTDITIKKGKRFSNPIEITLYRVMEEGLANALKHGKPSLMDVELHEKEGIISMKIQDDGVGFEQEMLDNNDFTHTGLTGMQERVRLVNGHIEIRSTPQEGTIIYLEVPKDDIITLNEEDK